MAPSASSDLAAWFGYSVSVERLTGPTAYGPGLAAATTEPAMIDPGNRLVQGPTGESVVSSARVFLPIATTPIPDGSRVTLPATFGSAVTIVISSLPHVSGLGTPDHLELVLA